MKRSVSRVRLAAFAVVLLCSVTSLASGQSVPITSDMLQDLEFRTIGPAVTGGRIHDVEALPHDPSTIYLATASGGIWKSTNKGTTWTPIFEHQPVSTFGDLAIAPSNSDIIWAGTGEQNNRQSTSWGNGVYRSDDGGQTWTHVGLDETRHIGEIAVHPTDPNIAYVAALGNLWAPSDERGVYKTTDGGASWERVLFVDTFTGVVEMVMDPGDPNTLFAATYQRQRRTWGLNGGGPGSGIYRTTDAGASWTELTNGLPAGDKGRIGLAIAQTSGLILNATVEHASESGVYRTEDGGDTWRKVNSLNPRPMYYSHIYIDPTNADRIYILATSFYKSEDGGRTFETLPTRPTYDVGVHSDFHDLWIDPNNPSHFYLVGDAGMHESWDMGQTHIRIRNLPIGQFYGIGVDMRDPYWIYGGMQDNHSWMGPSATRHWIGILNDDWRQIGFGDGMYQQPDPTSHRYVYVLAQNGNILRLDAETGDMLNVAPAPPEGENYRYDWVTPALVSNHDPNVVYLGGNRLFISRDRGNSWSQTDDLTKQIDRNGLELMGILGSEPMISKNDGTSSFGEITTIAESPIDPNILWVGTDDGNVQVSADGGGSWSEVSGNITDLPAGTYVSRVVASAAAAGTGYATFDAHRDGDFEPYVYRTTDLGASWTSIASGLPTGSVNVVVEHAAQPDVLFVGTE
ncbi:MAG: glycosyl hydrolase, partial [Gemmatimonadota bacterium]